MVEGFSKKHGCTLLVWYEQHDDIQGARVREYQMKSWKRAWKLRLIEKANPAWRDLFDELMR
jgi:putative endonuclease